MHCWSSRSQLHYFSTAGRLGLECEDDFSSPMQVSFVPGSGIVCFFLPLQGIFLLAVWDYFCFLVLVISAGGDP